MTGLGHFLAKQQMHLAIPAEDLEGDDDVDDIDDGKSVAKKSSFKKGCSSVDQRICLL